MTDKSYQGFVSDQIRLLVCTANLGNKPPDDDSLHAWIPRDGICNQVIRPNPSYPVIMSMERAEDTYGPSSPLPLKWISDDADYGDEDDSSTSNSDDLPIPSQNDSFLPKPSKIPPPPPNGEVLSPEKRKKMSESLAAWAKVLTAKVTATDPIDHSRDPESDKMSCHLNLDETEQFDLIVVGMQEATFDLPISPSTVQGASALEPDNPDHQRENSVLRSPVVEPFQRGARSVGRGLGKGVQKIAHLTQDRDYTKKKTRHSRHLALQRRDWGGGTATLHALLDARLPSYERIVSYQRGQIRLEGEHPTQMHYFSFNRIVLRSLLILLFAPSMKCIAIAIPLMLKCCTWPHAIQVELGWQTKVALLQNYW